MAATLHLSGLLGRPLVDRGGDAVGRVADVIVRLRGREYPLMAGLVAKVGGRQVFLPAEQVSDWTGEQLRLTREQVDLRRFERREGEVLLRADVLRHRLIDVADARLVRACDVELTNEADGWVVSCLDTRRPRRLFGLLGGGGGDPCADWKAFEPLIGHAGSARLRGPFGRVRRLKPAQIANLLEEASGAEETEILGAVHEDPELEADVFEEVDPDLAARLLGARTNDQIADVLSHMRADDAADAIVDLPQERRQPVLDLLPAGQRVKVLTLLGHNPTSAGGLMGMDFLALPGGTPAGEALAAVRTAQTLQPEALISVYALDRAEALVGVVRLVSLVQADPAARLAEVAETDPVRVGVAADLVDVALLMADYNLVTIPVVDDDSRMIGIITVDDVLEATIPEDWRRREVAPQPEHPHDEAGTDSPSTV